MWIRVAILYAASVQIQIGLGWLLPMTKIGGTPTNLSICFQRTTDGDYRGK